MASILGQLPEHQDLLFPSSALITANKQNKTPKPDTSNNSPLNLWKSSWNPVSMDKPWWNLGQIEYPVWSVFHSVDIYFLFAHRLHLLEQVWSGSGQGCGLLCQPMTRWWILTMASDHHPLSTASSAGLWNLLPCFEDFSLPFFWCAGAVSLICCLYVSWFTSLY